MRTRTRPIRIDELTAMVAACPPSLLGRRDRCVLVLGFGAALSRTELITLCVEDVERAPRGIVLHVGGYRVGIPTPKDPRLCPASALDDWLQASGVSQGPIIRALGAGGRVRVPKEPGKDAGKLVARTMHRCARRAGLDPSVFTAHSLRAGLVSIVSDKNITAMQRHGRWKHRTNVLRYMGGTHGNEGEGKEGAQIEDNQDDRAQIEDNQDQGASSNSKAVAPGARGEGAGGGDDC